MPETGSTRVILYQTAKARGRRNSIVTVERGGQGESTYEGVCTIADSSHGTVKLFKNRYGSSLAVKTNKITWHESEIIRKELERELQFLKLAYPDEGPYHLHVQSKSRRSKDHINHHDHNHHSNSHEDYRLLMPYFDGLTLDMMFKALTDIECIKNLILSVAIELDRLHSKEISHGDVSAKNIIVFWKEKRQFTIHFVDFGQASQFEEPAICTEELSERWAPERTLMHTDPAAPLSHPSQDVYSFSYTIKKLLKWWMEYDKDNSVPASSFNSILKFVEEGLSQKPRSRPSLRQLIDSLQKECKKDFVMSSHQIAYLNLYNAVLKDDLEKFQLLLGDETHLLELRDRRRLTFLHLASTENKRDILGYIISRGVDVNSKLDFPGSSTDGMTALSMATCRNNRSVARLLLEKGADINIPNKDNLYPIHFAASLGRSEVFATLYEHDPQQLNKVGGFNRTPLMLAAENQMTAIVDFCLRHHADTKLKDEDGKTAANIAQELGFDDLATEINEAEQHKVNRSRSSSQKR